MPVCNPAPSLIAALASHPLKRSRDCTCAKNFHKQFFPCPLDLEATHIQEAGAALYHRLALYQASTRGALRRARAPGKAQPSPHCVGKDQQATREVAIGISGRLATDASFSDQRRERSRASVRPGMSVANGALPDRRAPAERKSSRADPGGYVRPES